MKRLFFACLALMTLSVATAQTVWTPDLGNGKYKNPVLYADYSDPDVIRVGDDYWMTASSFNCVPGLPILHSTDLVNWEIVNHVFLNQPPYDWFDKPRHGDGVWAPCIRFHDGWYYIYWGDPDRGIMMSKTQDPRGEWTTPHLVKASKGIIDTSPLWDEDGKAYLVHGWAGSRAGFKSILSVSEMTPDGMSLIGQDVMIFDGHGEHPTIEGPKFYKRDGWYYVFAPAGGVKTGWQVVLRSRSPWGPYEIKTVLEEGSTGIPGPHQGGWVEDVAGDCWFLHFVDMYAYGRVCHLQPMAWTEDGWCTMGVDYDGNGVGEPVKEYKKPASNVKSAIKTPADSDEFSERTLGLQWQWHANPQLHWLFTNPSAGMIRLYCRAHDSEWRNLSDNGNLLMQKVNAPDYVATTKVHFTPKYEGDRAGMIMMGHDYATIGLKLKDGKIIVEQNVCPSAMRQGTPEKVVATAAYSSDMEPVEVYFRCKIRQVWNKGEQPRLFCRFSYSKDGKKFQELGEEFEAQAGHWIGAKIGYFVDAEIHKNDGGWMDVDWFRVSKK